MPKKIKGDFKSSHGKYVEEISSFLEGKFLSVYLYTCLVLVIHPSVFFSFFNISDFIIILSSI